eukprot:6172150-Pleurochrysis_carterae.AAC.1
MARNTLSSDIIPLAFPPPYTFLSGVRSIVPHIYSSFITPSPTHATARRPRTDVALRARHDRNKSPR